MTQPKTSTSCLPAFTKKLEEEPHLLHLELMKLALQQASPPLLGLSEPTISGAGTRRLHEANPVATVQTDTQTRDVANIVMNHSDFVQAQRNTLPNHPQVELPRLVQYDLFHVAEAMPETRSGAPQDALHSFFHHQEAFDTLLDHCQYFIDRQGFIMLMWHAFNPVWDNWNFYQITKQTGVGGEVTLNSDVNNPFDMLHLPGSMSREDQQKIIKRTIDGFWSAASTDSKALSFRKKLDTIAAFAKELAARKGSAIFRPYHEHSPGSWFWWCLDNLSDDPQEASRLYRKLFHKTRAYLEGQGVDNLLYCYSPDIHAEQAYPNKAAFLRHYRNGMPDLDQVDVLGMDVYLWKLQTAEDKIAYAQADARGDQQDCLAILGRSWDRALQMFSWLREEFPDKIVGFTETGWDYNKWGGSLNGEPLETFWQDLGMAKLQALPKDQQPHFVTFWRNDTGDRFLPWNNGSTNFTREATAIANGLDSQVANVSSSATTA